MTEEHEISCESVYDVLDQFVEATIRGGGRPHFMVPVRQHLAMCPDCREEYQVLEKVLAPVWQDGPAKQSEGHGL